MEIEYSGKQLFYMELAKYLKRLFFVLLIPLFLFGLANPILYTGMGVLTLLGLSYMQASTPRYKLSQTFKYLFIILIIALIELIRVMGGYF